jgi:hypothetical protein
VACPSRLSWARVPGDVIEHACQDHRRRTRGKYAIAAFGAVTIVVSERRRGDASTAGTDITGASCPATGRCQAPSGTPSDGNAAGVRHARYTKGCSICALAGIYQDHINWPGITPAERSEVTRLYQVGDKAGLFKLWQTWRHEGS